MKTIDAFCHLMPQKYAELAMQESPKQSHMFVRALKMQAMSDIDYRLEVMRKFPEYKQIPNIVSPPVELFAGPEKSPKIAAVGNDEIKSITDAHPDCYEGFIAGIPFNNVPASVDEIKRCKAMGAKGVQIYCHMNGEAIDQEKYWPVYEICEKLDLPVLIHPVGGQMTPEFPAEDRSKYELWFLIGWPYQTTVAICRLAFSGIFEDFPNLKIVKHHVGAMIPMLEGRIDNGLKWAHGVQEGGTGYADAQRILSTGVVTQAFFTFFLLLFLVSIGMKVGGSIGSIFKKYGMKFVVIGVSIPVVSMITACVLYTAVLSSNEAITPHETIGMFAGAMTSTPGYGTALDASGNIDYAGIYQDASEKEKNAMLRKIDASGELDAGNTPQLDAQQVTAYKEAASSAISLGYTVAFPMGVLVIVILVSVLPKIFRIDIEKEKQDYEQELREIASSAKKVEEEPLNFLTMSLVAVIGIIVGNITIPLGSFGSFSLGAAGGCTSAPGLGAAISSTDSDVPTTGYGAAQPFAILANVLLATIFFSVML